MCYDSQNFLGLGCDNVKLLGCFIYVLCVLCIDVDMRMRTMMILFVMLMTILAIMLCRIDDDDVMCYDRCQSFS